MTTNYTTPYDSYNYGNLTLSNGLNGTTWATSPVTVTPSAVIQLDGKDADVVINGESLKETLQTIKEALRIPNRIQQDAQLEKEFEEIRVLREKYEQKVREYKEKQLVWNVLKD